MMARKPIDDGVKTPEEVAREIEHMEAVKPEMTESGEIIAKDQNKSGFYCYIGPNIKGALQAGTVYRGTREDAERKAAAAIEKFPQVKDLIVPGDKLPVLRLEVKEPGTNLNRLYREITRKMKEG